MKISCVYWLYSEKIITEVNKSFEGSGVRRLFTFGKSNKNNCSMCKISLTESQI